ncbi:hypothetical protein CYY_008531 [Polysphondylium violaceum]|uniref:Uncharacterized protein n=1 Tax=Polysphondylium violaceum TaxID=133409 RepID=A0A8J4PP55_9MYCE|nr:hypothetical protein CYY_008531 [Polysphondylium violaceum]
MMGEIFKSIFLNKYLREKIYDCLRNNKVAAISYKYEDIVDVDWMLKNKHLGLLKEKLKRGFILSDSVHLSSSLFSFIANTDTQLFLMLFQKNKYEHIEYWDTNINKIVSHLQNLEVLEYMYTHGYARELFHLQLDEINFSIIKYLVDKRWYTVTASSLINYFHYKNHWSENSKQIMDLIVENIPCPLSLEQEAQITRILSRYRSTTFFEALSPLVTDTIEPNHKRIKVDNQPAVNFNDIKEILEKYPAPISIQDARLILSNNSNHSILYSDTESLFQLLDRGLVLDEKCFADSIKVSNNQVFFDLWKRFENKIRVTFTSIYFTLKDQDISNYSDKKLKRDPFIKDIGNEIVKSCLLKPNLPIIDFILSCGYGQIQMKRLISKKYSFFKDLVHLICQQDYDIISNICQNYDNVFTRYEFLSYCCEFNEIVAFSHFFPLFKDHLSFNEISQLQEKAFRSKLNWLFYEILEPFRKLLYYQKSKFFFTYSFKMMMPYLSTFIGDQISSRPSFRNPYRFFSKLLLNAIGHSDFVGVKFLFSQFRFPYLEEDVLVVILTSKLSLPIIDYIYKNQTSIFTSQVNVALLFQSMFQLSIYYKKTSLIQYFVENQENYHLKKVENSVREILGLGFPSIYILKPYINHILADYEDYFKKQFTSHREFIDIVYLIDSKTFDSIQEYVEFLVDNDRNHLFRVKILEYLYRNQETFKIKPSFQQDVYQEIAKVHPSKCKNIGKMLNYLGSKCDCIEYGLLNI